MASQNATKPALGVSEKQASNGVRCGELNTQSDISNPLYVQDLDGLDADIEAAESYERFLALLHFRVRKLILNLKAKRDALDDLAEAMWRGAA